METLFGFMIIIGIIAIVVGLILLIVTAVRKKSKKTALITLLVGILFMSASVVYVLVDPPADYEITTSAEAKELAKQITAGEEIEGKTIEAKISRVGDVDSSGKYLGVSTVGGTMLAIKLNDQSKSIKAGDTVTVKVTKVLDVLGLNIIYSELD